MQTLHDVFTNPELAPELHEVYGPFRVRGTQTAFAVFCPGGEALGTQIAAKSFGAAQTRGHKYAGHRPSKVVLDDTVNPKRLKNPEQRDEAWRYLQRDIDKVGARYTVLELVGTIQHADDLVARVAKSPSWQTTTWRNLIAWPKLMDRWDECRRLWADLTDPDRVATARGFYDRHREQLDDGAVVLWPEGRGLFDLMASWWQDPAAFWAEDQNSPRDVDTCLFDLEKIPRCRFDGLVITTSKGVSISLNDCEIAIWLDPSSGGKGRDFPAIAVVAHHIPRRSPGSLRAGASQGYCYVLSVELTRRQPSAQQEALWATWERYIHLRPKVGMDETGTQALLGEAMERLQEKRRAQGIAWQMPVRAVTLSENKERRIARLESRFLHGWLELAQDVPGEVIDQIRDFPSAAFDDALDAIERAEWLLTGDTPTVTRVNMERA